MLERFVSWALARPMISPDRQKEAWIDRCARRYEERANLDSATARHFAEACWESRLNDDESPEGMADEDMSYWTD